MFHLLNRPMQNQLIAQQRLSQLRIANPNVSLQIGGKPRIVLQQQPQQQVRMINAGAQQQQQQPQVAQPPPPPYPGPPPPYPGNNVGQTSDSQVRQLKFVFVFVVLRFSVFVSFLFVV